MYIKGTSVSKNRSWIHILFCVAISTCTSQERNFFLNIQPEIFILHLLVIEVFDKIHKTEYMRERKHIGFKASRHESCQREMEARLWSQYASVDSSWLSVFPSVIIWKVCTTSTRTEINIKKKKNHSSVPQYPHFHQQVNKIHFTFTLELLLSSQRKQNMKPYWRAVLIWQHFWSVWGNLLSMNAA